MAWEINNILKDPDSLKKPQCLLPEEHDDTSVLFNRCICMLGVVAFSSRLGH